MTKVDDFAKSFEQAVQKAFTKTYGKPPFPEDISSIRSSWSKVSVDQGWTDPDVRTVVVGTEHSWVNDPFRSKRDMDLWEKTMKILAEDGWGEVRFDSINAAVHVVFIAMPAEWDSILMKRAMERGRRF